MPGRLLTFIFFSQVRQFHERKEKEGFGEDLLVANNPVDETSLG
jgi:hypothetical protein